MKKRILLTGASSGFGKLTVPLLLQKGHTVVAGLRGGHARLGEVFPSELKQFPQSLSAIDLHLEQTASFKTVAQDLERSGGVDILINNAGYGLMGALEDQTEKQLRHQMEVNFFGTAFLTQAVLPLLRRSKGRILTLSSIAGLASFPFYGSYSASKFALEGLMQGLAFDLAPFGVQVGMIEPGGFRTDFKKSRDFAEHINDPSSPYFVRNKMFLESFDEMASIRQGDPVRVARLITKLCDSKRVPFQNVIGKDARLVMTLKKITPNEFARKIFGRVLESAMSRGSKKKMAVS